MFKFVKRVLNKPFENTKKWGYKSRLILCLAKFTLLFLNFLFSFSKPVHIGFLRVKNEQNTVVASLMSIEEIFDKIVIIYSQNDDNSINLIKEFIEKSENKNKFVLKKYEYPVLEPFSKEYYSGYDYKNSLAAYYNYGFNICKKYARFRNGCIVKLDADQIYIKDYFLKIFAQMQKEKFLYAHCAYGIDGIVKDNTYKINYARNEYGTNGGWDHFFIPNTLSFLTTITMHIIKEKDVAFESVNYKSFMNWIKGSYNIKNCYGWFHFNSKDAIFPHFTVLKPLTERQYQIYREKILPYLQKANSSYLSLNIDVES